MSNLLKELLYAARMLLRNPGMTVTAVLTMALGVGANTAIFSGVNSIFLNPIPGVARSAELVEFYLQDPARGIMDSSSPEYRDYRERNEVFEGLLAYGFFPMYMAEGGTTERVFSALASGNFFDVLGVRTIHGRTFEPADDEGAGRPVVVISHGLWQRHFGGRLNAVGKTVALNSHYFTVIGITPPEFRGTVPGLLFDAWVPLAHQDLLVSSRRSEDRALRWLSVIGRLKHGISPAQAESRLNVIAADLAATYPQTNANLTASLYQTSRSPRGAPALMGPLLIILMGVMGLLLLITCANVANLLLSRAIARQRDIAIRLALGAGRGRLIRLLLIEALELAAVSGVVGLLVGYWTTIWLGGFIPVTDIPIDREVRIEPGVLLFALAVTTASGIFFGLVPALQTTRPALVASLKDDASGAVGAPGRSVLRSVLVVAQIALSLVLLVAAGLFLRSLLNTQAVETGFDARNVLLGSLFLPMPDYDESRGTQLYQQLIERIETLPEVRVAALVRRLPLGLGGPGSGNLVVEGYTAEAGERPWSYFNFSSPGYFRALGAPLVSGRDFTFRDNLQSARVAVINQTFAAQYFKGREPIGGRLHILGQWATVIGVVRDFKTRQLNEPAMPLLFLSGLQSYRSDMTLLVRTAGDPEAIAPSVRQIVREMDPELPLYTVRTLERHIETASFAQRASASFLSLFAVVALLLAAVGIYGVMSYGVSQRTRELGIRIALGAQPGDILRLLLKEGAMLTAAGVILGLAGALVVARLLAPFLLNLGASDNLIFAAVTILLALVSMLACYLPARKALQVDPVIALRHD